MPITMETPEASSLDAVVAAVASWQCDGAPLQLHPGDLGWYWRFGADALAGSLRVWHRDGEIQAVGFLDGANLLRMGVAPTADEDDALASRVLADIDAADRGVLPAGDAIVEARFGAALRGQLRETGWVADEPWTPLRRDLTAPVADCGLRVEVVGPHHVEERVQVQRAAFTTSTFTVERWHAMAAASAYRRARCLVGYDGSNDAVAAVPVWSAGPGSSGLLEPMGVHQDHRLPPPRWFEVIAGHH